MRSALRSKTLTFIACLFVLSAAQVQQKDRFLFRVSDQVVSVQDIKLTDADFAALGCHLPDSILLEYVGQGFRKKLHESVGQLETLNTPLGQNTSLVIFLASMRQTWKLLTYIDAQDVTVASDLEKSFLRGSKCPTVAGADKKMRASFRRWLRVEIYLRSRYAQGVISQDAGRKEKRFHSISLFVDSLDKQLPHEDFW